MFSDPLNGLLSIDDDITVDKKIRGAEMNLKQEQALSLAHFEQQVEEEQAKREPNDCPVFNGALKIL